MGKGIERDSNKELHSAADSKVKNMPHLNHASTAYGPIPESDLGPIIWKRTMPSSKNIGFHSASIGSCHNDAGPRILP